MDFDAIIVGSGPAGVSAAFPLVEAGWKVLLVDGGRSALVPPPQGAYLDLRAKDGTQWQWMIGRQFQSLKGPHTASPKLRVPTHRHVFEGFEAENRISADSFIAVGSMARGGLSNAWGCGAAALSHDELARFPCQPSEMESAYEAVASRIGLSGACDDDLSGYFGLDRWAGPPIPMDALHARLLANYRGARDGFRLGRSRMAVLSVDKGDRAACDRSGNCMWGCHRKALYASGDELGVLARNPNLSYRPGFTVEALQPGPGHVTVQVRTAQGPEAITAGKVLLAAGTLASTRLVLLALRRHETTPFHSCPTAAFLVWVPRMFGQPRERSFGLGQLAFAQELDPEVAAFGSLIATTGVPVAEFVRHVPLGKRNAVDLLSALLGSCTVGNVFLPGHLTEARMQLRADGSLQVQGRYPEQTVLLLRNARSRLAKSLWRLGGWMLPGSFTIGQPGGDIHYGASLPMRDAPGPGESDALGQPLGLTGVHVVDGASLPFITEKSHTLTIMANAHRIGAVLARQRADGRH